MTTASCDHETRAVFEATLAPHIVRRVLTPVEQRAILRCAANQETETKL
jgi:hypothetical protein